MAIPAPSVQAGPSARVASKKRPASASLSDADTLSTNSASTSTMRSNTAAVDAHKKKRRRRRKPSVTKAAPSFVRTIQRDDDSHVSSGSGSFKGKERAVVLDDVPELPSGVLPDPNSELASLREKMEQQTTLLTAHKEFLAALAPSLTCQICLEPMHRPYALAPCGHTACYGCLIAWFRAPPQHITHPPPPHLAHNFDREDPSLLARDTPMLLRKEKTCPHCRAVVREVPVEAWGIKDIVAHLFASKGNMVKDLYPDHVKPPETRETGASQTGADAWKGVFKRDHARAIFNTLVTLGTNGGTAEANEDRERGGDRGFYDDEDNVYRCTVCYHEVWDGICTACGRLYPGLLDHAEEEDGDDDGGDWMDAENFQEEDWMDAHGYEDPDEDALDLHEIFGEFARNARLMRAANHHEDEEEGYESSFIDDEDGGARIEEYHSAEEAGRSGSGDEAGDADEEGRPRPLPPVRVTRTAFGAGRRRHSADPANATIHLSDSDSDASGHVANYRRGRGPRAVIDSDEDIDNGVRAVGTALAHQPAPRAVRPVVVDSDSGSEDGRRSDSDVDEGAVFRSRSVSRRNSISGDDSDELSEHREFYGSGSGSSHYNDAFSDEDNGINWSD